eukprot:685721-Pleurochrysis_carterae.AAC.6
MITLVNYVHSPYKRTGAAGMLRDGGGSMRNTRELYGATATKELEGRVGSLPGRRVLPEVAFARCFQAPQATRHPDSRGGQTSHFRPSSFRGEWGE